VDSLIKYTEKILQFLGKGMKNKEILFVKNKGNNPINID
jgi:hypothetical protein